MALNAKQQVFVAAYLVHKNATQAAIEAGYSKRSAGNQGDRMMKNDEIKAAIDEKMQTLVEKLGIGPEYILGSLKEINERCMQKQPVMEFDPVEKKMVETGEWKFEHSGATKALELLGKYQKMWTDNVQLSGVDEILDGLRAVKQHGK
jgi:phage terminase small subunit